MAAGRQAIEFAAGVGLVAGAVLAAGAGAAVVDAGADWWAGWRSCKVAVARGCGGTVRWCWGRSLAGLPEQAGRLDCWGNFLWSKAAGLVGASAGEAAEVHGE